MCTPQVHQVQCAGLRSQGQGAPIAVSGESVSVRDALKGLEELVQQDVLKQRAFLPVNILPEDLGVARGKGGSHATKIQEEFGVKLRSKAREHC